MAHRPLILTVFFFRGFSGMLLANVGRFMIFTTLISIESPSVAVSKNLRKRHQIKERPTIMTDIIRAEFALMSVNGENGKFP